jgi:hypothetical protein
MKNEGEDKDAKDRRISLEFIEFAKEFENESDRAAVILGAAKLDNLLYQILSRFLMPSTSSRDEFLEGDSPGGTFSARIMLVLRLGLIDAKLFKALTLIRRIRNSFAHECAGVSLESGAHKDRVRELFASFKQALHFDELMKMAFKNKDNAGTEFRASVAYTSLRLEGLLESLETIKPPITYALEPRGRNEKSPGNEGKQSAPKKTEVASKKVSGTSKSKSDQAGDSEVEL